MSPLRYIILSIFCLLCTNFLLGQSIDTLNKKKLVPVVTSAGIIYSSCMIGLYHTWYKDTSNTSFHWHNDNLQWNQMDKLGHIYSGFYISRIGIDLLRWSGVSKNKAVIYGALNGFIMMSSIELFDGYSASYGASWGDILANGIGAGFVASQYLFWNELRILPKFSYHETKYANIRPNVLGDEWNSRLLKDYNGQTYWYSFNLRKFFGEQKYLPKGLCFSIGYGADEMVYGNESQNNLNGYHSYRQYYLSLDLDLESYKSKKKWVNTILYAFNTIKIPMPSIEFNKNGIKAHALYF
jgi:uncharacterized protein YfiM (DUF2279 family)